MRGESNLGCEAWLVILKLASPLWSVPCSFRVGILRKRSVVPFSIKSYVLSVIGFCWKMVSVGYHRPWK